MIEVLLAVLGLVFGSFVNALVWRINEQSKLAKQSKKSKSLKNKATPSKYTKKDLSILKGRSMCPSCQHTLASKDLIPLLSWLQLGGKCRYCHKSISVQYPLVELSMALLFLASYIWWPFMLHGSQIALFVLWLAILVGLLALVVYDIRWFLLPNRIIYPLSVLAIAYAIISIFSSGKVLTNLLDVVIAVVIGGGIFYLLFQVSGGKWIGGGDVRLGWLLGLIAGTPGKAVLFIFLASIIGTLVSLPLLLNKRLKKSSLIPFGPFLIAGMVITELFGSRMIHWYTQTLIR
jgi:prepilin signal peptidase PulO-like enzyme (type II secretory pathway)